MAQITVSINNRVYEIACDDGQEEHLARLGTYIDSKVTELAASIGQVGDARLLVMASLLIGVGNGGLGMTLWAAFSDVARQVAPGREGLAFAIFSASAKLALGAGVAALAVLLAVIPYRTGQADWIRLVMAAGPMLGSMAMVLLARVLHRSSGVAAR